SELVTLKLTTRLYISLAVYLTLTAGYHLARSHLTKTSDAYSDKLQIKVGNKSVFVDSENIKWIKSDKGMVSLYTEERKYTVSYSLKQLSKQLNPETFKRIHRSTIVNTRLITSLNSRLNGDYDVTLQDGTELRLSRNYAKPLKGKLFNHH
ncbi:MAG: LytTR family DNA-binding domain-containing protein, partial [Fulvivirga sp.]|nr:LytTR family DNA-binding domain-containing protein [Fulvivirga sp.]